MKITIFFPALKLEDDSKHPERYRTPKFKFATILSHQLVTQPLDLLIKICLLEVSTNLDLSLPHGHPHIHVRRTCTHTGCEACSKLKKGVGGGGREFSMVKVRVKYFILNKTMSF